jgi:hypothetical protein
MSLPACQQRVLDRMEGALRASEPHLTSMYAIFSRLNAGEPVGAERIGRSRSRWLRQGTAMYAIVLIPVMFAAIIVGALLGGGTRSAATCDAGYSVGGFSPLASRPSCPVAGKVTGAKAAVRKTLTTRRACATAGQAARFVALTGGNRVFLPAARAIAAAGGPPGGC